MSNLNNARVTLHLKQTALKNAESTLKFFKKSADANQELIKETQRIIEQLKSQITDVKKEISQLEKRAKKKK